MGATIEASAQEPRATARERVLAAARTLFSEHGVSGTSLQMIADHLGVTKAAVYHQFHAKDEIVLELLEKPLAELRRLVAVARAMEAREQQLDVLLPGLVEVVIRNPEVVALIQTDPHASRLVQSREEYRGVVGSLAGVLAGPEPEPAARVASALFGAGLMLLGHHPLMTDIDPETMRRELPRIARRLLV